MKRVARFIWALTKYIFVGRNVAKKVYEKRLSECHSCQHLFKNKCGMCGCYVEYKAKWSTESCPIKKW